MEGDYLGHEYQKARVLGGHLRGGLPHLPIGPSTAHGNWSAQRPSFSQESQKSDAHGNAQVSFQRKVNSS